MKRSLEWLAFAAIAIAPVASAQMPDTMIVMTVPLKHISGRDAVALLKPYAMTTTVMGFPANGEVSAAPGSMAITIRERPINYARMLRVLADYDKAPPTVAFEFQLILADKSGKRATEIASLDSVLRSTLKYTGYQLIGTSVLRSSENTRTSNRMFAEGNSFELAMEVADVRAGPEGNVRLDVNLNRRPAVGALMIETLIKTGVTIPIGQTVVLGSAAFDKDRAIILTVRPQLVPADPKGRDD